MRIFLWPLVILLATVASSRAQQVPFQRLPIEVLDVLPPAERVAGAPGRLSIQHTSCRTTPTAGVRRRVVDVAVQEWGFFGFTVIDQTVSTDNDDNNAGRFRRRRLNPAETARTAADIAGYWTVTPEGAWIIENQNKIWNGPRGVGERWRTPWSAAFISWVMCEGGLGESSQFRRAIAHHSYIDQAIRTRDQDAAGPAFAAYDAGEAVVEPGDLLCTARRPEYRTLAQRRRQMGEGARTHCDVVVKVDDAGGRIMAIGGNVQGAVSLKILPAARMDGGLRATTASGRSIFAHLKLRASPIEIDALDHSPTIRALGCAGTATVPVTFVTASLVAAGTLLCAD
jgi:hypothetical protein